MDQPSYDELAARVRELEERSDQLLSVFDGLREYVYVQHPDFSIGFCNQAFRDRFGDPAGRPCYEVIHNRDEPCRRCPTFEVFESGEATSWEWSDDNGASFLVRDVPVFKGNQVEQVIEIGIDITARKHAEELTRLHHELVLTAGQKPTVESCIHGILETLFQLREIDCGGIYLIEQSSGALVLAGHRGLSQDFVDMVRHYPAGDPRTEFVLGGELVCMPASEFPEQSAIELKRDGIRCLAVCPISVGAKAFGCMNLGSHNHDQISDATLQCIRSISSSSIGILVAEKLAVEALRNSEKKWRDSVDHAPTGIFTINQTGHIVYVNPAGWQLTGFIDDELAGRDFLDFVHPDDSETAQEHLTALASTGHEKADMRILHRDGRIRHVTVEAVRLPDGPFMAFCTDITDRVDARDELERITQLLQSVLSQTPIPIFVAAPDRSLLYANPACRQQLGIEHHRFLERGVNIAEQVPPWKIYDRDGNHVPSNEGPLNRALRGEFIRGQEIRVVQEDGAESWHMVSAAPVFDSTGKLIAAVGLFPETTEQKIMEERLRQSEKMEAVGQLAGGIAHDFNNQLTGISAFADLLRFELEEESEASELVDSILLGVDRAADLTGQLLAFSRKGKYHSVPVDIHRLIDEVVRLLRRSVDKRITIHQKYLAPVAVTTGDPTQLQNAILNLALNARDAMQNGGDLTFVTDIVELDEDDCQLLGKHLNPGPHVQVEVRDTGVGMSHELTERIFEPFFTTKEQGQGTGMGLAAVYGTVRLHMGSVEVFSKPGHGSRFVIKLPKSNEMPSVDHEEATAATAAGQGKVLLVEDEPVVRRAAVKMLKKLGYEVASCANGKKAIEYYRANWPTIDLVLLDMVMPEMNGKDTFLVMQEINPKILAVVATGYSVAEEARNLQQAGIKGLLQKPFRIDTLARTIKQLVG